MKQLTKTEQLLLERAQAHPHKSNAVIVGSHRSSSCGGRESRALASLESKGLIQVVSRTRHKDYVRRTVRHWTEIVYKLV